MSKKNEKTIFHSFREAFESLGFKVSDQKKEPTQDRKDKFVRYHLCPNCKRPMTYCGGNIMVCMNDNCKGIQHKYTDQETGEERIWYSNSYHLLDEKGASIANNLFGE